MTDYLYDRPAGMRLEDGYPWAADLQTLGWVPDGSRVLELGCATGYMGAYLRDHKRCRLIGVEQDAAMAEKARPHYERIIEGDLDSPETFNAIPGTFDIILCSNVLEHLRDPLALLKRLHSRLEARGRILVALPNIAHWSIRWQLLRGRFPYQRCGILDRTHLRFYTYETAQELLQEAGYQIMRISFDADSGIPLVQGIIRRIPIFGWKILWLFYRLRPNLWAYQTLLEAERA